MQCTVKESSGSHWRLIYQCSVGQPAVGKQYDSDSTGILTMKVAAATSMPEHHHWQVRTLPADLGMPIIIIYYSDNEGLAAKRRKVESQFS